MPFFRNDATVNLALESLFSQSREASEVLIVDDCSEASANELIDEKYMSSITIIRKRTNEGLAAAYNSGIASARGEIIVLMHPDVVLQGRDELKILLDPFQNTEVVAAAHQNARFSPGFWDSLNIYEKAVLGAALSKRAKGFDGKFDAIRRNIFSEVGYFDSLTFRTAGEDGDFVWRIKKRGVVVQTLASAEHQHDFGNSVRLTQVLEKSFQYGQALGALTRKHRLGFAITHLSSYWREIGMVLIAFEGIVLGAARFTFLPLLIASAQTPVLVCIRDSRIRQFPLLLILQFAKNISHSVGFFSGFMQGKQI
jgi:GT2 family glycosyltransferase